MTRANDRPFEINEGSGNSLGSGMKAEDYQLGRLLDNSLADARRTAATVFGAVSIQDDDGKTCAR
jgi:hypothetical protein